VDVPAGLTGTYAFLYTYGGPVSAIWGWCLVVCFNFMIGLILSEICSAYPTSGGVYYWAHKLGSEWMLQLLATAIALAH
jgi:amino acid transporter